MRTPSRKTRRWLYRVGNAALAVAVGYNLVNGELAALWLLLLNALLGLAELNVPDDGADG